MKITLTLEEALQYIRAHEDLAHLVDAEISIEGFTSVGETKPVVATEDGEKPRRRRKRKTPSVEPVTQDTVNDIVSEVDTEIKSEVKRTDAEAQQLTLIDEVLAEEKETAFEVPEQLDTPLVEQETPDADDLDLSAPLFS